MSHHYTEYNQPVTTSPRIIQFFQHFYNLSDTPTAHEEYAQQFTENATFILGSKKSEGREAILETRKGMWAKVSARKHTVRRVYNFGGSIADFMLYGEVEYTLLDGTKVQKDWAARAFVRDPINSGPPRLHFYQVYLDTAA